MASSVAQTVASVLEGAGASKAGAAGVLGNAQQESSINPASSGGYLLQWQGSRAQNLANFAKSQGKPITDAATQAQFAVQELKTQYPSLWNTLRTAKDPAQAALAFSQQYERPGIPMNANRMKYAQQLFNEIGGVLPGQRTSTQDITPGGTGTASYTTPGTVDKAAIAEAIQRSIANKPINTTGKVTAGPNVLEEYNALADSGKYTSAPTTNTVTATATGGSLKTTGNPTPSMGGGNLDPIAGHDGWVLGRTDQGVDATAHTGAPVRATNTSQVVQIVPNWYKGQPLVLTKLLDGPDAGKYVYVAEQITPSVHVGQIIPKGGVIATYAPSGTGIEIGWGSPGGGDTLAQATTGYTEGEQTPAGKAFRQQIIGG